MNARGFLRQAAAEPTLHFAAVAGLLFVTTAVVNRTREVVEIDQQAIEWRIKEIERGRGAPLSASERLLAERAYIDEHVLARVARERGLDSDDRIRGILSQKMLQVLSATAIQPTDADLLAYYEQNRARYTLPSTVTAERWVEKGGRRLQQMTLERVTNTDLMLAFGEKAASAAFDTRIGHSIGPFPTASGEEWLRVIARAPSEEPPPLTTIREQVRFDWMAEREVDLLKQHIAELRDTYSIKLVDRSTTP
jgi:hypothetical protein